MKRMLLYLLLVLPFIMISCSDDKDPVSSGSEAILPVTLGTYWLYETWDLDGEYNRTTKHSGLDSSIITGTTLKLGKQAAVMTTYSQNKSGIYTKSFDNYYYNDKSKLYVHSDYIKNYINAISSFITIDEKWMKIADENDDDWTVLEQKIDTVDLILFKIWGNLLVRETKGSQKEITLKNKKYTAQEYIINLDFEGMTEYSGAELEKSLKVKAYLWFVKGIGLVKNVTDRPDFILSNDYSYAGERIESYILDYNIK